ncbi:glycosyltransferase family 4 protein [Hanstruepera flava]|uniref:glycosyltransferase family 4 protein n=1 Tax=Hanstruepera flava TaxID=2930218 RepID=UPI00202884CB|nr:glycosyltransferase family 4 protein [Hanstruepera flava]
MKKRKIAFIIPSLQTGGAERVVVTLSNSLSTRFDVTIIALYSSEIFYALNPNVTVKFCSGTYKFNTNPITRVLNHFKLIKGIYSIVKQNKIEVMIGFMTTPNVYAVIASKIAKVRCIISERVHPNHIQASKFWGLIRKKIYPFTDYMVIQTQEIADYFSSFIKVEKIKIILNPLNPELLNKIQSDNKRENVILNVGRLDYQKNQDMLIRAFSNIERKDWKLFIAGDGSQKNNYLKLIDELNLTNSVELLGNIDDLSHYYNSAKIFAFTSRYEGFPNALTEAMAFGLACVSTDCPSGPSELIFDNKNGILIPVEDQTSLEVKLQLLMDNEELRTNLSLNAQLDTQKFEHNVIADQWELLIQNLLSA